MGEIFYFPDYRNIVWEVENFDNTFLHQSDNWQDTIEELASYYGQRGTGIIAKYKVFK